MKLVKAAVFHSRYHSNEPAIAFGGGIATYGGLMKATGAAVEAIKTFEMAPGTAVMLDIRNPIHHVAMIYALALLGLPSASLGATFVAEEAGFVPGLLLTDRSDVPPGRFRAVRVDERWFASEPSAQPDYQSLLSLPGFDDPNDVVRYVYSSGTTGHPKCVALTQQCLNLRMEHSRISLAGADGPILSMMGFSTVGGMSGPLVAHTSGTVLCFASSLAEMLQMVNLFGVTGLWLAVGQLEPLFNILGDQPPPKSLSYLGLGGSKITRTMLMEARARICSKVLLGYGSTEMSWISLAPTSTTDMDEGFAGHIFPWVDLEVVDHELRPLPSGQDGTVRVRTPELAYYVNPDGQPVEMLEDGWFYPGDIGRLQRDGRLYITGRSTEVINRGGVIVAPELIEEVLRLDRRVSDVAVVGMPNSNGIEEIWAAVVSDTLIDPRSIIESARSKLNEKVPDRVIQVATIPRAEGAKVRRLELREQLKAKV
jgi:acyl-coenzyme A synthetase/AMP-(fatty) acid ligase